MEDYLSKCPLFAGISESELLKTFRQINYNIRKYNKGHLIVMSGEKCEELLMIMKGSVTAEMADFSGKILKIENISAPKPLAVAFIFGENNFFPVDIIANESVEILSIPKASVIRMLQMNQEFLKNFLNSISNRTQFLSGKIKFLSFKTLKVKLAHYILQLAKNNETKVIFPSTQQDLAEFFGVARPSVARALSELEADGIIKVNRKEVKILDRQKLTVLLK